MQRGGGSKDTWVLRTGRWILQYAAPRDVPVDLSRGVVSDLPEQPPTTFWLGRYAERGEAPSPDAALHFDPD